MSNVTSINKSKKSRKAKPAKVFLKPQNDKEWLEIMDEKTGAAAMRTRIRAATDTNDTIKICMMAADTAGLDELDRMTITAFNALVQLEDIRATIDEMQSTNKKKPTLQ